MDIYINNKLVSCKMGSEEMYDKYPVLILKFQDYIKVSISIGKEGLDKLKDTIKYIEMDDGSSYFYNVKDRCEFFDLCKQKHYKDRKENKYIIKSHCTDIKALVGKAFCPIRDGLLFELSKDVTK